jgi:subtilisin family serine protease
LWFLLLALSLAACLAGPARAAADSWETAARAVVANAKVTDQAQAMDAFREGGGIGKFFVSFAPATRAAAEGLSLADEAGKRTRRQRVQASREAVLAAMPELPQSVIRYRYDNLFSFSVAVNPDQLAVILANPEVASVEPVMVMEADLRQGMSLQQAAAYRSQYSGQGLAIAICDTGINYNNPYLGNGSFPNAKVIGGTDVGEGKDDPMDGNGHGTACAGIAAGDPGNSTDYIGGVASGAKLYALKITYDATGKYCHADAYVAAWDWCVTHQNDHPATPIKIISTSFTSVSGGKYTGVCDTDNSNIAEAAKAAKDAGITLFNSAGNSGYCDAVSSPACISSIIAVGSVYDAAYGTYRPCVHATSCVEKTASSSCTSGYCATDVTQADQVPSYSNAGSVVGLLAPANLAFTLGIGANTFNPTFGGTSAACPYAAGAAAVLQAAAKDRTGSWLTPDQVLAKLSTTGQLILDPKSGLQKPRINLKAAIETMAPATATGFLQVSLTTPAPLAETALWQVDGGAWRASQEIVSGLAPGTHTVSFKPVTGWNAPASRTVSVTANQTASLHAGYGLSGTSLLPLGIPAAIAGNSHGLTENFTGTLAQWTQQRGSWSSGSGQASVTADGSETNQWYSLSATTGTYGDFTCAATMRRSGAASSTNALFFRGTPLPLNSAGDSGWYYGYLFGYTNNGSFAVFSLRGWNFTSLQGWTSSSAIVPNDWNTLSVRAVGTSLTFFINGTQVFATTDSALSAGQVGVGMYTGTGGTLDVSSVSLTPIAGSNAPVVPDVQETTAVTPNLSFDPGSDH